jgi:cell division protein FtsW
VHKKSAYLLVLAVMTLLVLGIVMLFSTSAFARDSHGDPYYFVKRQAIWLGIGMIALLIAARVDYHFWQKTWWVWLAAATALLALCFVPPIGMKINGSHRWVNLRLLSFQPSELGKLASVIFLAYWFSRYQADAHRFFKGFVIPMAVVGLVMTLIMAEVDLGTTALLGATMFAMMFVAGTSMLYILPLALAGVGGILIVATRMEERLGRLMAFLYPERFPDDFYQQLQGLIAFGSGGVDGLGLGNGRQKNGFLPFAHTDFILPMVGEELGLRVTLLVVFAYLVILMCATIIALRARDRFGMLLGFGIVILLALQAAVNIGVTTAILPNKGLPLPFISYGGSNLVMCLLGIGILINIYRQGDTERRMAMPARLRVRATPRL